MSIGTVSYVIAQAIEHSTSAINVEVCDTLALAMLKFNSHLTEQSKFFDKEFERLLIVVMPKHIAEQYHGFNYSEFEIAASVTNPRIRAQRRIAQTAFIIESIKQFGDVNNYA